MASSVNDDAHFRHDDMCKFCGGPPHFGSWLAASDLREAGRVKERERERERRNKEDEGPVRDHCQ